MPPADLPEAVVSHHLRLFGLTPEMAGVVVMHRPGGGEADGALSLAQGGKVVAALVPQPEFLAAFSVQSAPAATLGADLRYAPRPSAPWAALRSLHPVAAYSHAQGQPVVVGDPDGAAAWLWLAIGDGGVLFVGSDLAADLIRFRQGDPRKADERPTEGLWGIAGERPVYLYEDQLAGHPRDRRPADDLAMALTDQLASRTGAQPRPMLPGGAPGAVVITGDDDQAWLEKYQEQLDLLDGLPITYFMHPLTRHTPETLSTMLGRPGIEIEIHPDALETPDAYGDRMDEQSAWFRTLTGRGPRLLRNHGFLNDGYWGHLPHWRRNGVYGSSNIPGLDGQILNGSLLPARIAYGGELTEHWSLLTAVGDGVRFINEMTDQEAGAKVLQVGRRIEASGIPGILALNLHPQNVAETRHMHLAVRSLVESGFQAWNLGQCLEWFAARDGVPLGAVAAAAPSAPVRAAAPVPWLRRLGSLIAPRAARR